MSPRTRRVVLGVACLAVAGCVWALFTGPVITQVELWGDGERDLFQAWAAAHTEWEPSHGPMIGGITSATLGTGWVRLMQVVMTWAPGPLSVYKVHVALTALGVGLLFLVLWTRINPWTAVLACLLLVLSIYFARALRILWHPALAPAFVCYWFCAIVMVLTSPGNKGRAWWLVLAWAVVTFLMQLHLIGLPYVAILCAIQARFWWQGGWRHARIATAVTCAFVVALSVYTVPIVLELLQAPKTLQLEGGHTWSEKLTFLVSMFGCAWIKGGDYEHHWNVLGIVVLCAASVGLVQAWRRDALVVERWIAILVIVGGAMTVFSLRVALAERYVTACGPGVCILAGLSLSRVRMRVPKMSSKMPMGLVIVLFLLVFDPLRGQSLRVEFERGSSFLNVVEIEQSLEEIHRKRNLNWRAVRMRVHGLVVTAPSYNYVSLVMGLVNAPTPLDQTHHWTLITPGQPPPAYGIEAWNFDAGSGRLLGYVQHHPRFAYDQVRFSISGEPCAGKLPYQDRSQPAQDVLEAVGMPEGGGTVSSLEGGPACRLQVFNDTEVRLMITVPPVIGAAPLTLLVSPFVTVDKVEAVSESGEKLAVSEHDMNPMLTGAMRKCPDYLVYEVAVVEDESMQISLPNGKGLVLDIY